jgi:hypothetical protein
VLRVLEIQSAPTFFSKIKKLYQARDAPHEIPYIAFWEPDDSEILEVLSEVGFKPVPVQPGKYSAQWLKTNLPDYGPMFAGGFWGGSRGVDFHAVVIYGVEDDPKESKPILIKDPWPPGQGGLMPSMSLSDFNAKKNPRLQLHYLPRSNWRHLCNGLPVSLGGPTP